MYGKTKSATGSQANDFQFAGQQTDPTGLQYLRARYYDPSTGTFLSRDPLAANAYQDKQHPFGYAGGNPVNATDPSGRTVVDVDTSNGDNSPGYITAAELTVPLIPSVSIGATSSTPPTPDHNVGDVGAYLTGHSEAWTVAAAALYGCALLDLGDGNLTGAAVCGPVGAVAQGMSVLEGVLRTAATCGHYGGTSSQCLSSGYVTGISAASGAIAHELIAPVVSPIKTTMQRGFASAALSLGSGVASVLGGLIGR